MLLKCFGNLTSSFLKISHIRSSIIIFNSVELYFKNKISIINTGIIQVYNTGIIQVATSIEENSVS